MSHLVTAAIRTIGGFLLTGLAMVGRTAYMTPGPDHVFSPAKTRVRATTRRGVREINRYLAGHA